MHLTHPQCQEHTYINSMLIFFHIKEQHSCTVVAGDGNWSCDTQYKYMYSWHVAYLNEGIPNSCCKRHYLSGTLRDFPSPSNFTFIMCFTGFLAPPVAGRPAVAISPDVWRHMPVPIVEFWPQSIIQRVPGVWHLRHCTVCSVTWLEINCYASYKIWFPFASLRKIQSCSWNYCLNEHKKGNAGALMWNFYLRLLFHYMSLLWKIKT